MPYDARAIANYFLNVARAQGETLTQLKIQKLVYFANGWHLAIKNTPVIDEQVEAWPYGPVIPSLYREFRHYRDQPICEPASSVIVDFDEEGDWVPSGVIIPSIDDVPDDAAFTKSLLDRIWDTYGRYTAIQLSNLTHQDGTPWHRVFMEYNGAIPKGTDIPSSWIKDYFLKQSQSKATSR